MTTMSTAVPGRSPIQFNHFDEQLSRYYPQCELVSKGWWVENARPDWVILECGANVGYNTILFSQLAPQGQIHAFEPTPLLGMLENNLSDNRLRNAIAHNVFLTGPGDKASIGINVFPSHSTTIDRFVEAQGLARVDAIKIDVATFDVDRILAGAEATLRRFSPYVILDSSHTAGKSSLKTAPCFRWLSERGYDRGIELESENYVLATRGRQLKPVSATTIAAPRSAAPSESAKDWSDPFNKLRQKWSEVPAGNDQRRHTTDLLQLPDEDLRQAWIRANAADVEGTGFGIRGWYHRTYGDLLAGKRVVDVGSGFAISTLEFAMRGAAVTFCDIAHENLEVLKRLCKIFGVTNASFHYIENEKSFGALPDGFDAVTAIGSLIHAPSAVIREEVQAILPHLRIGGRWLHLAYPKRRWERDGSPSFSRWGAVTDGAATPWAEYHERDTMAYLFAPAKLQLLFECSWHNDDFNWFDLELVAR